MKKISLIIFLLSFMYGFENSIFEFSYGNPKVSDNTISSQLKGNYSINFAIKNSMKNYLYKKCFIEYNIFDSNASKYEMYLIGLGVQRDFDLSKKISLQSSLSFGISDDQYKIKSNTGSNIQDDDYTFDDNYMFARLELGASYSINSNFGIFLNYKSTYTNEQYGVMQIVDFNDFISAEYEKNIQYSSLNFGFILQ